MEGGVPEHEEEQLQPAASALQQSFCRTLASIVLRGGFEAPGVPLPVHRMVSWRSKQAEVYTAVQKQKVKRCCSMLVWQCVV